MINAKTGDKKARKSKAGPLRRVAGEGYIKFISALHPLRRENKLVGKENLSEAKGGVFALGNFDGVHRGHRRVFDVAIAKARAMGEAARVLTFEPNPRSVFHPELPPFRLTPAAAKERLLKGCGMDDVVVLPFTPEFAQVSAQEFVERILLQRFNVRHIVVGHDFIFGHKRGGNIQNMTAWLAPHGVGVTEVLAFGDICGAFSSTRIRACLQQGEVDRAAKILGRDWSIAGTVVKGAQLGRTIGVPTANIALGDYLRPKFGVYAVRAGRVGEALSHRGVANIGVRPTVDGVSESLEAHMFDFDQDIYGQEWEFALTRYIRPEQSFDGLEILKAQIQLDIAAAKA